MSRRRSLREDYFATLTAANGYDFGFLAARTIDRGAQHNGGDAMNDGFRKPDHWIVRAVYVLVDGASGVDAIDALVEGEALPPHGGISHNIGNQPFRTTLEWRVDSLAALQRSVERLEAAPAISDVVVDKLRRDRVLETEEFSIRRADVLDGKAICVACGGRIPADHALLFAVEGVRAGNQVRLRCAACKLPMDWIVLDD